MKNRIKNFIYSFPIQLFLLHVKKHPLLMLYWILLTLVASNNYAKAYGGPYLLLNPEYLGTVSSLSYMMLGFALGGFMMTWNTCFYMLNSFRFKFLVSLARPFVNFCFNNFIIPLGFNIIYITTLVRFHLGQQTPVKEIWMYVFSLIFGQILMIILVVIYFSLFNKNVERFLRGLTEKTREKLEESNIFLDKLDPDRPILDHSQWPVETYMYGLFRWRYVRSVDHYDISLVRRVLRQHHLNTLLIIVVCVTILLAYGIMLDNPAFRIPAGAALMLIFSVTIAIACVISYWAGGWRIIVFAFLLAVLNIISGFEFVVYKHKLLGLDYKKPELEYSNQAVIDNLPREEVRADIQNSQSILWNWKSKLLKKEGRKPYIIFLQSSGGGLRAGFWSMHVLQQLEAATGGRLMDHTFMMSGASGGMMGNALFRHLYFLKKQGRNIDPLDPAYRDDIGKDVLNAIFSGIAANDLLFPWQSFKKYGQHYRKDRAYWFDNQMLENTGGLLLGKILDYTKVEQSAELPMMIFSPTIINDQRVLLISANPVSYLCLPYTGTNKGQLTYLIPDGVEYMRFFKDRGAENIDLTTAMRLNATYPYVLPAAYLPTYPEMKIMDAGLKENHGFGMSTRFINVFRRWIEQNTAGIIFVQIRSDVKLKKMDDVKQKSTLINEILLPFGNIYSNFLTQQDYNDDMFVAQLANSLKVPVHIIPFIYTPSSLNKEASMSFHLTHKEKLDIIEAYGTERNQNMEARLKELLRVR